MVENILNELDLTLLLIGSVTEMTDESRKTCVSSGFVGDGSWTTQTSPRSAGSHSTYHTTMNVQQRELSGATGLLREDQCPPSPGQVRGRFPEPSLSCGAKGVDYMKA